MLTFILGISCLTTSNLPWFMDLTYQVPMQYCSLQHWTLLLSSVTSTAGYCFCFGSIHPKRCPFHYRGLECQSRKSRNTWSNRQIWPWNTEWSRAKANSFAKKMHWSEQTPSSNNTREDSTHGHHQMINTEIRLIIFFAAKDGEALYSQQKQDQELTVAQIMNSSLPNSDLNWRK